MPRKMTKQECLEIYGVDLDNVHDQRLDHTGGSAANTLAKIVLFKRNDDTPDVLLFDDIIKRRRFRHVTTRTRKAENDHISDANQIDPSDTPTSLLSKLNDMCN